MYHACQHILYVERTFKGGEKTHSYLCSTTFRHAHSYLRLNQNVPNRNVETIMLMRSLVYDKNIEYIKKKKRREKNTNTGFLKRC